MEGGRVERWMRIIKYVKKVLPYLPVAHNISLIPDSGSTIPIPWTHSWSVSD